MKTTQIKSIETFIHSLIGLDIILSQKENSEDDKWQARLNIQPNQCGAVAPIFKDIDLYAKVYSFDYTDNGGNKGYKIFLEYSYLHPSGSNGYTTSFITIDDCATFQPY